MRERANPSQHAQTRYANRARLFFQGFSRTRMARGRRV